MGWETRGGRGKYYTRSKRVDGLVVREYVGSGEIGELAARFDEIARKEQRLDAAIRQAERDEYLTAQADRAACREDCMRMVQILLLAEGYHQHDRGEWRRRRD